MKLQEKIEKSFSYEINLIADDNGLHITICKFIVGSGTRPQKCSRHGLHARNQVRPQLHRRDSEIIIIKKESRTMMMSSVEKVLLQFIIHQHKYYNRARFATLNMRKKMFTGS